MGLHVKLSIQQGLENVCNRDCGYSMTIWRDGYVAAMHIMQGALWGHSMSTAVSSVRVQPPHTHYS